MITWPTLHAKVHRASRRRPVLWHRDEAAAARAIARWEDDGGLIDAGWGREARPPSTDDTMIRREARYL